MIRKRKKEIAIFFLLIFSLQFYPTGAYALTSGPVQPEMAKFEPAGATDMVNLFSGDLNYNIPLLDIGGYPINIAYQSGSGVEDEASWVGAGWILNPGSINRTMRGLPDDFDGDEINKTFYTKPFKKVGAEALVRGTLFGWETGKVGGTAKVGVYKDNYYGIGATVGASVGFQQALNTKTSLNAGLNLLSDTRGGVDISPNLGIETDISILKTNNAAGLSGSFQYNTRAGLKATTLGASFSPNWSLGNSLNVEFQKNFGQTYTPTFNTDQTNSGFTFSFDVGGLFTGGYGGVGATGYVYNVKNVGENTKTSSYGYINYLKGRGNSKALLDFNREKDGVFLKSAPAIATPVATHDYFNVTAQTGSQQFRPIFNGNYIVSDRAFSNISDNSTLGLTYGGGSIIQGGGSFNNNYGRSTTNKWVINNSYLDIGEASYNSNPLEEAVYFKQTGEQTVNDPVYFEKIGGEDATQVVINENGGQHAVASPKFKSRAFPVQPTITEPIKRTVREKRVNTLSYLTAQQGTRYALEREINGSPRIDEHRKAHHISEMTVTDNEGKRMVYGIPVYNLEQHDVTFAIDRPASTPDYDKIRRTGLISYTSNDAKTQNGNGRDEFYQKESLPAYATTYLLTGVLSGDYVDLTGNGISDDDPGSAIKFNYTKQTEPYAWRGPFGQSKASYSEGFLSDPLDDKASYSYGKREVWYLNSIESKTMIAIFSLGEREDGVGVTGETGTKHTSAQLKKLEKITLYTKADWLKNATEATPVKTVYFEYDYSLYPGISNRIDNDNTKGKLTLKKVWFTFGKNSRGKSHPYEFNYDLELINEGNISSLPQPTAVDNNDQSDPYNLEKTDKYTERQTDRWGTYKQSWYNHLTGSGNTASVLNNSEFPYALQKNLQPENVAPQDWSKVIDKFVTKWQLNRIITPSGSIIDIEYESDDYAYVQDRRAMQMCFVKGVETEGQETGLIHADKIIVGLPVALNSTTSAELLQEFKEKYMARSKGTYHEQVYYKMLLRIDANDNHEEYVHGYADIDWQNTSIDPQSRNQVKLGLKKIKPKRLDESFNPIAIAAWQMLKTSLPQYAYESYDNLNVGDGEAAIRSIWQALKGFIGETAKPFEGKASKRKFADKVNLSKSMVRLTNPDRNKTGGGCRVKKIMVSDEWASMTSSAGAATNFYGQLYEYKNEDGSSSGVASYEPQIGNDENPFHEPINYTEKVHWSNDKYHFIEKPFCESYFPAAQVGYARVKVSSFGDDFAKDNGTLVKHTGYIVNEFYTAKDFPTIVDYLPLDAKPYATKLIVKIFSSTTVDNMVASQGFKIELNDMHGKPKSVKVFDKKETEITSSEYIYNVRNEKAEIKELLNEVDVLVPDGTYNSRTIGTDIEFVSDVRESISQNNNERVGVSGGVTLLPPFAIPPFIYPIPIPFGAIVYNNSEFIAAFHSVSAVKVIRKSGVLKKVIARKNGSQIETENLLWDGETGNVLLTKVQNEFDKHTYAFSYPGYLAYEGMGGAYENLGAVFSNLNIQPNGNVSAYSAYLFPGDELVSLQSEQRGWVIMSSGNILRLVDQNGEFINTSGDYMLTRSGRRNLQNLSVGSVVCMNNPMIDGKIRIDLSNRILDSRAVTFSNEWQVPVNNKLGPVPQCTIVQPSAHDGDIYHIESVGGPNCNGSQIGISNVNSNSRRSFIKFSTPSLPPDAIIQSAKLSLYASTDVSNPMLGENEAYIKRVTGTEDNYCSGATWSQQPSVTDVHQVLLPRSTSTTQNYLDIDITDMYKDWKALNNGFRFSIRLSHVQESGAAKQMIFNGYFGESSQRPKLEICYTTAACIAPVNKVLNPYYSGVLGNWRPKTNYVYTISREQKPGNPTQSGGTDIRSSGYYKNYTPFWNFENFSLTNHIPDGEDIPVDDNRWVWSNKSIYFDQKGNEIESVDALGRYSAALFGYRQSLSTAVAANARHNEIMFDGFEDYGFDLGGAPEVCPLAKHFDWGFAKSGTVWVNGNGQLISTASHTGRYSYQLSGTFSLTKAAGSAQHSNTSVLGFDASGKRVLLANELAKGFSIVPGKDYVVSMWIKDNSPQLNTISGLAVSVKKKDENESDVFWTVPATTITPVVEGWKRLEFKFKAADEFNISLTGSGILIDDIRIFPNDGQMNSYVYDETNMRLMAQLDENNFATLYEYDDEGTLIRLKKETERGVMTLKENRQSFRKRQ